MHARDVPVGAKMLNFNEQVVEVLAKDLETEPEFVYNFEVDDCHTYYVGDAAERCVLGHNADCKIHDNNILPDSVDRWLNAERNGPNRFLFDNEIYTCTCGQHTSTIPSAVAATPICPETLAQNRLSGLSELDGQMEQTLIVLASFNGPSVFYETFTGNR